MLIVVSDVQGVSAAHSNNKEILNRQTLGSAWLAISDILISF